MRTIGWPAAPLSRSGRRRAALVAAAMVGVMAQLASGAFSGASWPVVQYRDLSVTA